MKIKDRQMQWAEAASVACSGDYCSTAERNLHRLSNATRAEFEAADGQEFSAAKGPPKIAALHSSSALAVNFFEHWREQDKTPLAAALGIAPRKVLRLRFEQKFPTGIGPRSPNIDVALELDDGSVFAIESKFTEWMGSSGTKPLRGAYLPKDEELWTRVGLPGAQRLAASTGPASGFKRLDVPQLLKHMLGLANQAKGRKWHLLLLWHRCDETEALKMDAELASFKALLGVDGARFTSATYQELWGRLRPKLGPASADYASYLEARYF